MNIHEAVKYAKEYLYKSTLADPKPTKEYKLNRKLQYLLCVAFNRIEKEFGEVTKRDIVFLAESWCMSNGSSRDDLRPDKLEPHFAEMIG